MYKEVSGEIKENQFFSIPRFGESIEDIEKLVVKINQNEEWSEWTKYDYKVALKKFYKWFNGGEECHAVARWIPTKISKSNHKMPEELLTEEEVKKMVICDKCKEPILKVSSGVVVWNSKDMENKKPINFKIFHKCKCDDKKLDYSMELRDYFWSLENNCIRDDKVESKIE